MADIENYFNFINSHWVTSEVNFTQSGYPVRKYERSKSYIVIWNFKLHVLSPDSSPWKCYVLNMYLKATEEIFLFYNMEIFAGNYQTICPLQKQSDVTILQSSLAISSCTKSLRELKTGKSQQLHRTYGPSVCLYSSWCVFSLHEFMSHQCPCRCVLWVQFESTLEVGDCLFMLVVKAVVIPCKIFDFSQTLMSKKDVGWGGERLLTNYKQI